jgi:hypothetical protein
METELFLKPASPSDLFTDDLRVKSNKVYFEYSYVSHEFQGPYTTPIFISQEEVNEFYSKIFECKQSVFLPCHEEYSAALTLVAKVITAKPEDLKVDNSTIKVNFSYFLYHKNKFIGPFTIMKETDPKDLKKYLDEERIFILDNATKQREFLCNKKAS